MAQENDAQETETKAKPKKDTAKLKKIIMLAVLGVLVIAMSVGGTLFAVRLFGPKPPPVSVDATQADASAATTPARKPAIYYPIKPPILATYEARGRQRYVQAEVTLMFRDDDVLNAIELHMPMIRDALMMTISGQVYEEAQTAEGKELLRLQCLELMQEIMQREIGKPGIEQVLFTGFVMQ